jgi:hypothetical protein
LISRRTEAINARTWILGTVAAGAAAVLFSWAISVHMRNSCAEMDTPYLRLCPERPAPGEAMREELRERITHNPGDANAWTRLLVAQTDEGRKDVLRAAAVLAPNNHNVARWRAVDALQGGRLAEGTSLLVQILRNRPWSDVARILVQFARTREGVALLRPHLGVASEWLPQVLAASDGLKVPPGEMLPLVVEAMQLKTLPDRTRRTYMRSLKASGNWLDAYGLWMVQQGNNVPLLFNGGFDQPIEQDGFDWELATAPRSRAGALVAQQQFAKRGLVLDVEFTGRSFTLPLARQYLFLRPGNYRIHGEYMASKLRSERGLNWAVVCTAGRKALAGRSSPLLDTAGRWQPMEVAFTVPPDCGVAAILELRPVADYEATAGMKGHIAFDSFSLDSNSP